MLRRNGDRDGARVRGDTASRIVAPPRRIRATTRDAPLARDDGMRGPLGTRTPISRDTYSACNFHLPSTICTITRARESKPL